MAEEKESIVHNVKLGNGNYNENIEGNYIETQNIYHVYYPQDIISNLVQTVESNKKLSGNKIHDFETEIKKIILAKQKPKPSLQKYRFEYAKVSKPSSLFRKLDIEYCRKEAKYFTESLGGGVELEMTSIPSGTFLMGSNEKTTPHSWHSSELPQHLVSVNSFFIGKYPITQKQWKAVACLPQINRPLIANCSKFKGDSYPVEEVCWDDAVEFCHRLSLHTSQYYRLPSEAEWEYAARAGTTTLFNFGDIVAPDLLNYKDCGFNQTTSVDKFQYANAFGLYSMHGLVWEWCINHWLDTYKKAPSDSKEWLLNNRCSKFRVIRGGSWADTLGNCRSACRKKVPTNEKGSYLGFRVICEEI